MARYDHYVELEPTGLGNWLGKKRVQAEWRIISRHSNGVGRVAEIGPGHGIFGEMVSERSSFYLALESNFQIAEAIASKGLEVCQAIAPLLPLSTSSVDLLYASHVIEHMPNPDSALALVQEARRVLRPEGLLVLVGPDSLAFRESFWDADYTHTFPVTMRRMRQLLADGQFCVLDMKSIAGPVTGLPGQALSAIARYMPTDVFFLSEISRARLARVRLSFLNNVFVVASKSKP